MSTPSEPPQRFQGGRFVLGLLVALFGVAWLLEATGAADVPWKVVLPVTLIAIGLGLVGAARTGRGHGGLITLGIVLTVLLALGSIVEFPLGGGIGDRSERPRTVAALEEGFELSMGKLTVDLTAAPEGGAPPTVEARVGIGRLVVIVPEGLRVAVHAEVGIGRARVFGEEEGGVNVRRDFTPEGAAEPSYTLELSVGVGDIEVVHD